MPRNPTHTMADPMSAPVTPTTTPMSVTSAAIVVAQTISATVSGARAVGATIAAPSREPPCAACVAMPTTASRSPTNLRGAGACEDRVQRWQACGAHEDRVSFPRRVTVTCRRRAE